jgi:hypothetical protein
VTGPSLITAVAVIAWIAGWIGYFIGRRKEAKWRECATWWHKHAVDLRQLCEERGEHARQAMELLDKAHANASRTRELFTELLPPGIREKMQRLNEEFDVRLKKAKEAEAANADEFPSELDIG